MANVKTYFTHNNGDRPFKIIIDNKKVYVYKYKKYDEDTNTFLYSEKPIKYQKKKIKCGVLHQQHIYIYIYVKLDFLDYILPWTLIKPNNFSNKTNILEFKICTLDKEIIIK